MAGRPSPGLVWGLRLGPAAAAVVVFAFLRPDPALLPAVVTIVVLLAIAGSVAATVRTGALRRPAKRELGRPFLLRVLAPRPHARFVGTAALVVSEDALSFETDPRGAGGLPERISTGAVRTVRVQPSVVEIEWEDASGRRSASLAPASFADRERLLWEMAVRAPAAVERGLEEERTSRPATPGRPPAAAAAAGQSDVPSAAAAMADLDARMDGLGTALAGPGASGQRAPPKSGLGCGLFVAEPRDDRGGDDSGYDGDRKTK
jgi:hypothetical protein